MTARCAATWPFRDCAWKTADGAHDVVGLAPVAVAPGRQRRGIGSALIREGHRRLVEQGESLVFVLGDPAYYTRFGYSLAAAAAVRVPHYSGPHFMALRLNESAPSGGKVRYPAAFDGTRLTHAPLQAHDRI